MKAKRKPAAAKHRRGSNQQTFTPLTDTDTRMARRFLSRPEWVAFTMYYEILDHEQVATHLGTDVAMIRQLLRSSQEKLRYYFRRKV